MPKLTVTNNSTSWSLPFPMHSWVFPRRGNAEPPQPVHTPLHRDATLVYFFVGGSKNSTYISDVLFQLYVQLFPAIHEGVRRCACVSVWGRRHVPEEEATRAKGRLTVVNAGAGDSKGGSEQHQAVPGHGTCCAVARRPIALRAPPALPLTLTHSSHVTRGP